ncbi:MAG: pteridine reductase [Methylococcaceae bacterium]|nr:pteridine reductase [Methylococcaceae bacterium]
MQKNVLITGAAKRIGAACAKYLHSQGCNVFLHYNTSKAEALQLCFDLNQIRPDSAYIMQANLLKQDELEALAAEACAAWGKIDVLVNNASTFYPTVVADVTEQQWNDLMGSNLKAPFFLAKALAKHLADNKGSIVNIVDIHADRGLKDFSVYCMAKAGLVAMTKILAKEFAPAVRVNAIALGAILWPEEDLPEASKRDILQRIALGHCGEPDDIAKALWFLTKHAEYMTGQILTVDGGRTLFY